MEVLDGNTATARIGYFFSDVAFVYPITPSSPMCAMMDQWSNEQKLNAHGNVLRVFQLESEMGVAAAMNGAMTVGTLAVTYTCSQGLLLMVPSMYKMAGTFNPGVIHVTSRMLWTNCGSLFANHMDVYACSKTGFALLSSGTVQEAHDMAAIAHLSTVKGRIPFLHFFSGMRISHEINKVSVIDMDGLKKLFDFEGLAKWREEAALRNTDPFVRGAAGDSGYTMQLAEAMNTRYDALPDIVEGYMKELSKLTGRKYHLFDYVGHPEAERVIVAMGHPTGTVEEAVKFLVAEKNEKIGCIKVHLFRPWSAKHLLAVLPESVRGVAVLDLTKEPGSQAENLYLDVALSLRARPLVKVVGGRAAYSGKEFTPADVCGVFANLTVPSPKDHFTIGIFDDVTHTSLERCPIRSLPRGTIQCVFFGLAADGTIGANKESIKLIGEQTERYAQGYFMFDAKKSGGYTVSHLRFGPSPITAEYQIEAHTADYVAVHNPSFTAKFEVARPLAEGGTFVLTSRSKTAEELGEELPSLLRHSLAVKKAKLYVIDAFKVADDAGLGVHINMVMQTVFFRLSEVLPFQEAVKLLKDSIRKMYAKKGDSVIDSNLKGVDATLSGLKQIEVPASWADLAPQPLKAIYHGNDFLEKIAEPILKMRSDDMPVSDAMMAVEGRWQGGTTKFEKRGVALKVPVWDKSKCIQCTFCSMVCPHACIRPVVLPGDAKIPSDDIEFVKMKGVKGDYKFRIQVSPSDCMGCGLCINECPKSALSFAPIAEVIEKEDKNWAWTQTLPEHGAALLDKKTVKGSQMRRPYVEFSGACAGCCETSYMKLLTQLYGDHLYIANATGCSMIWAAWAPSYPYGPHNGRGPAWECTLFENNAEFGFGMTMGLYTRRQKLQDVVVQVLKQEAPSALHEALKKWQEVAEEPDRSLAAGKVVIDALPQEDQRTSLMQIIYQEREMLQRKYIWIVGGDGWAYDIGSAGVDHILCSGLNVNVLILDTEVYSNTGGQVSKGSALGQVAQFAAGGKRTKKKDFGIGYVMSGDMYVAQVSMGANKNQLMKAMVEATSFDGPSLVIAYCPCIAHGIVDGMGFSHRQQKLATETGYWPLYRFDPRLRSAGKNPLQLDSKIKAPLAEFLASEIRFSNLSVRNPELAKELNGKLKSDTDEKERLLKSIQKAFEPVKS